MPKIIDLLDELDSDTRVSHDDNAIHVFDADTGEELIHIEEDVS